MTERKDLARVGDLIDMVLGKVARSGVAPIVQLRQRWDEVAGEWAQRCRPIALRNGVVTLEVASGMDASMLRFSTDELLRGIRAALGDEVDVNRIAVRVRSHAQGPK